MFFEMNGYVWSIVEVAPNSSALIDRTGTLTVATTDPITLTIYISSELQGEFKARVLAHELGHASMFSYYLVDDIHRSVYPEYHIAAEEWACNFIADYGWKIFQVLREVL